MMHKSVILPTCLPVYSTYHFQMVGGVVAAENPQLYNWYLNNCVILQCGKQFLQGYTSPEVNICQADGNFIPHINRIGYDMRFLREHVHPVIKNMLNEGFYIYFDGVDDFYVKGKSWYQEKHFNHDGLICGYDDEDQTYRIMAYDQRWICRVFKTPQQCYTDGVLSMLDQKVYGKLVAMKADHEKVDLDVPCIKAKLIEYLNSNMDLYPLEEDGLVFGIVVHDYIGMYLDQLYDGTTPYDKKDRRVFRLLWEHKKCMSDRILAVEKKMELGNRISKEYLSIVQDCELMRMIYAKYNLKRNDELLLLIKEKLIHIKQKELKLLGDFILEIESEEN